MAKFIAYRDNRTVEDVLQEWDDARKYGNYVDQCLDDWLNLGLVIGNETKLIQEALEEKNLKPLKNEWVIYNEQINTASAVDLVCEKDGKLVIVDLKSMKKPIEKTSYKDKRMSFPLGNLPDCRYYKQSLQVGFYRDWIKNLYKLPVSKKGYVLRVRPEFYEWLPLEDVSKEIKKLYKFENEKN